MQSNLNCFDLDRFRANLPYPSVAVPKPNLQYAKLISTAYAGRGSETTAFTQYVSHSYFAEEYADIYNAYHCIASVELTHIYLLGHLIKKLGAFPRFISYETNQFWNGSFPSYCRDLVPILQSDIEEEHRAIAHYKQLIGQIDNESIQNLLRRIILDEEKHIEVLNAFLKRFT